MLLSKNNYGYEETSGLLGTVSYDFPWPCSQIIITNDSSTDNLQYKFKSSLPYLTIKPKETVSLNVVIDEIHLSSMGATYRVWIFG